MTIPDPNFKGHAEVIEEAKRLGTYGKFDRSAQYAGRSYSPALLLKNDDLAFYKIRKLESRWHPLIVVGFAAFIARSPEIVAFVLRYF
jgi:hypothetical protein